MTGGRPYRAAAAHTGRHTVGASAEHARLPCLLLLVAGLGLAARPAADGGDRTWLRATCVNVRVARGLLREAVNAQVAHVDPSNPRSTRRGGCNRRSTGVRTMGVCCVGFSCHATGRPARCTVRDGDVNQPASTSRAGCSPKPSTRRLLMLIRATRALREGEGATRALRVFRQWACAAWGSPATRRPAGPVHRTRRRRQPARAGVARRLRREASGNLRVRPVDPRNPHERA